MSFVDELRQNLLKHEDVREIQIPDGSPDYNFVGLREKPLTLDFFAFAIADRLTKDELSQLCKSFSRLIQTIAYGDAELKHKWRNPNGLLGLVFLEQPPIFIRNFIQNCQQIKHSGKSVITVTWAIDTQQSEIIYHNSLISTFPPVWLSKESRFPPSTYLEGFLQGYGGATSNNYEANSLIIELLNSLAAQIQNLYTEVKEKDMGNVYISDVINNGIINASNSTMNSNTFNNINHGQQTIAQGGNIQIQGDINHSQPLKSENKEILTELTKKVDDILEVLYKQDLQPSVVAQVACLDNGMSEDFKSRAIKALKAEGNEAFDQLISDSKLGKLSKEAIASWFEDQNNV